ncbi:MAG: hypothetical protein ACLVL2_14435 [Bacteroides cellulosilyticus]
MLIILCTAKIVFVLSKTRKKKAATFIELAALAMLLVSVLLPLFLLPSLPYFIPWYGAAYFLVQASWHSLAAAYFFHYGAPGRIYGLACRRNCRIQCWASFLRLTLNRWSLPVPAGR